MSKEKAALLDRQRKERLDAYAYGETHTDENLLDALRIVLRKSTMCEVAESMQGELIDKIEDRNLRIDLQAHKEADRPAIMLCRPGQSIR